MPAAMVSQAAESHQQNEAWLEAVLNLIELISFTDRDLIDHSLETVIRLTGSSIGYLHFVNDDQERYQLFTWSQGVLKTWTPEQASRHPLRHTFLSVERFQAGQPVIQNDYKNASVKTGFPIETIPVVRHMSVPITDDKEIVAITGVGNKEKPYAQSEARCLSLFMNSMWGILKRERRQAQIEQWAAELQQALAKSRTLSGLLPICANCKRIRDDEGRWNKLESYLREHTDAGITHGICPECAEELYPHVSIRQ